MNGLAYFIITLMLLSVLAACVASFAVNVPKRFAFVSSCFRRSEQSKEGQRRSSQNRMAPLSQVLSTISVVNNQNPKRKRSKPNLRIDTSPSQLHRRQHRSNKKQPQQVPKVISTSSQVNYQHMSAKEVQKVPSFQQVKVQNEPRTSQRTESRPISKTPSARLQKSFQQTEMQRPASQMTDCSIDIAEYYIDQ
jgi:hypothetical protein